MQRVRRLPYKQAYQLLMSYKNGPFFWRRDLSVPKSTKMLEKSFCVLLR